MQIVAEFKSTIVPTRVKFNGQMKKLKRLDDKFIVRSYKLYLTQENELLKLVIDAPHPNSNPKNNEFCLAFDLVGRKVDKRTIPVIESLIKTFNLDDCYFQPWRDIYFE